MKIISWNVNGIRAVAKKWFMDFFLEQTPDIFCIQETKAFEHQLAPELTEPIWYQSYWHKWERPGYAGTAIYVKDDLNVIDSKNHFDEIEHFHTDGRVTEIKLKDFVLLNCYFPNGGTRADGTEMLTYKLEFYNHIIDYANKIVSNGWNVIVTGDFNICHTEIDIARPEANQKSIGFLPIEREKITELLENGYVDVFRYFNPTQTDSYTWWSYRAGARPRNVGWRLDYFVVNKAFVDKVKGIEHLTDVMGSDHCPIVLELK